MPKIRFTFGNLIGLATLAAGWAIDHQTIITGISAKYAAPILAIAGIVLTISKSIVKDENPTPVPAHKEDQKVIFEKTI